MQNIPNAAPGTVEAGSKKSLKERALGEIQKYVVITVYLWLLFALFSLHKQLVVPGPILPGTNAAATS